MSSCKRRASLLSLRQQPSTERCLPWSLVSPTTGPRGRCRRSAPHGTGEDAEAPEGVRLPLLASTWELLSVYGWGCSLVVISCCPESGRGAEAGPLAPGPSPPRLSPPTPGTGCWAGMPPPGDLAGPSRHRTCRGGKFGLAAWVRAGPATQPAREEPRYAVASGGCELGDLLGDEMRGR